MLRRVVFACFLLAAVAPLAGCGQKGPLTLPPAKPAVAAPASTVPAPARTVVQPAAATRAVPAAPPVPAAPAPAATSG